jgi:hypothetical protein
MAEPLLGLAGADVGSGGPVLAADEGVDLGQLALDPSLGVDPPELPAEPVGDGDRLVVAGAVGTLVGGVLEGAELLILRGVLVDPAGETVVPLQGRGVFHGAVQVVRAGRLPCRVVPGQGGDQIGRGVVAGVSRRGGDAARGHERCARDDGGDGRPECRASARSCCRVGHSMGPPGSRAPDAGPIPFGTLPMPGDAQLTAR